LAGIGWNAFSWQLPTLSAARGVTTPLMDNPGNFYLEILCETGVAGALLFAVFMMRAAKSIGVSIRSDAGGHGAAAALIAFAASLVIGSHLLAAEVSIGAFLLLADIGTADREVGRRSVGPAFAVAFCAALGWGLLLAPTSSVDEAFRYSPSMGLYPWEIVNGAAFRWMRPRAALRLASGARERWTLDFPAAGPGQASDRLTVRSEDRLLFSGGLGRPPMTLAFIAAPYRSSTFLLENSSFFRPSGGVPDPRVLSARVLARPR
jgi:hypothetical protein